MGRRSLSTLELECLSFTHQTICFICFIFSPSDLVQSDRALMMKHRGHPSIMSELACIKVCLGFFFFSSSSSFECACWYRCNNSVIPDRLSLTQPCRHVVSVFPPVLPSEHLPCFFHSPHSTFIS